MDRDTVRPIVLAVLAVLAIGLAAATLNTAVTTDSGGFGFGSPSSDAGVPNSSGGDAGPMFGNITEGDEAGSLGLPCYPVLSEWWTILLLFGLFVAGAAVAYWRLGALGVVAYVGPVGLPLLLAHAILTSCVTSSPGPLVSMPDSSNNSSLPEGGSGAPGAGEGISPTDPSVLLMLGLAVALVGAIALLFTSSSGDDPEEAESFPEAETDEDIQAVGRAAGEAADRIESATNVENEVYRAWREMTTHLDVANPQSSTPAEFAAAATDAGMAREDVTELTDLFEAVRYGGETPTDEREARAVEALRRIEREYAGASSDGDGDDEANDRDGDDR
ncbi:DUF4129 domain-containing protein [Halorussus halophilus]|uniref:DUF4129 domain-containing protein n=1 Tax=Halorussus halophilus TaxID=2650975 RepID=UPI0013012C4F|nr:DUF4129 domain-containing protein [Halorussus halophilus]